MFEGLAATWTNQIVLTDHGEPEFVRIGFVTPDFFSVLGVEAAAGRVFSAAQDEEGGPTAILLSFGLWQRRFGADPGVVGRTIAVNEHPAQVVGVLPSTFRLRLPADSGIPDGIEAYQVFPWRVAESPRGQRYLRVVGRLEPGVRLEDARHEVGRVAADLSREHGAKRAAVFRTVGLEAETTQEVRAPLWIVTAGVALLLVAAAVNVLAVLAARAVARRRETALRVALGAGPSRIVRLAVAEGLTLAVLGAGFGVIVGRAMLAGLLVLQPVALRRLAEPSIDGTVLVIAFLLAIGWGSLFALAPLGVSLRSDVRALLGSARAEGRRLRLRARASFAVAQIAVTAVLLVAAGLFLRTFQHVLAVDPGFDARGVLAFRVPSAAPRGWSDEGHEELARRLRARLRALPSVTDVGAVSHLPYDNIPNWAGPYSLVEEPEDALPTADYRSVGPGFFETARVSLREGRFFDDGDGARSDRVAIVDETLARRAWPGGSALGRRLKVDPGSTGSPTVWVTVVGVVGHVRHRSLLEGLGEQVYFPLAQAFRNPVAYLVRTDGDPAGLTPAVRQAVQTVDPRLPIYEAEPLVGYVERARGVGASPWSWSRRSPPSRSCWRR
jgi:predicted permease